MDLTRCNLQTLQLYVIWLFLAIGACYLFYSALDETESFLEIRSKIVENVNSVRKATAALDQMMRQSRILDMDKRISAVEEGGRRQDRVIRELSRRLNSAQVSPDRRTEAEGLHSIYPLASNPLDTRAPNIERAHENVVNESPSDGRTYVTAVVIDEDPDPSSLPARPLSPASASRRRHEERFVNQTHPDKQHY